MAVTFLTNEDGKKFVKSINDIQPDENGNVQIVVENPDVDLTGYATEKWVHEGYQPKGEYLTAHQDISGKLDADKLPEAINAALAQAKDSGEFDGYTPVKNVDYFDGQDYVLTENDKNEIAEIAADLVNVPDENSDEVYILGEGETIADVPEDVSIVIDIDGEPDFNLDGYVKTENISSVINTALAQAKDSGEFDGYTPVRGTDYWTEDDVSQIENYIDVAVTDIYGKGESIPSGANLNSYTEIGKYFASSNSLAQSLDNCPTSQNFMMYVFIRGNSSPSQMIIDLVGKLYIRSRSTSSWGSWVTYITAGDLTNAVTAALQQAKESGEFDGKDGDDYVLTDADKNEIAELASGLVDIPENSSGGYVVQDTAPEDTSVLWVDTSVDEPSDEMVAELVNAVLAALPTWTGGSF